MQTLQAYVAELRAEAANPKANLRNKYQHKILTLLIEREYNKQSLTQAEALNAHLEQKAQSLSAEVETMRVKIERLVE